MGKTSRDKGKRGERDFAKISGGERIWWADHDVLAHGRPWEVKFFARGFTPVYLALEEYEEHATDDDPPPIVAFRMNNKRWVVSMYYDDFKELL